jgi:hypothetical protein
VAEVKQEEEEEEAEGGGGRADDGIIDAFKPRPPVGGRLRAWLDDASGFAGRR